jgi:ribose transport system substrate-binding protein
LAKSNLNRLYLIPILSKALDILEVLESEKKAMSLEDIFQRLRISKTSVYRILKTFVHRGYLAQSQDGKYRAIVRPKKLRFGFASQSVAMPFSQAVTESMERGVQFGHRIVYPGQQIRSGCCYPQCA